MLTGAGGDRWMRAARDAAERLGVQLDAYRIAPRAAEPADDGAMLVRPDQVITWRAATLLGHVLGGRRRMAGRQVGAARSPRRRGRYLTSSAAPGRTRLWTLPG
ncbi:hypothetical protein ACFLIM_41235 [Nonomuraea sp. M3C6]|uniref:Uncharacterized protein n=1 Tax=Nonomuraea marmarensis TaxID=3351344 RepID=A0ABW7AQD7_9ACTN